MKHKFGLLPKVLLAIALGIVFGLFVPEWFTRIALTFNNIFGNFLNFVIPLLILGLVAPGIADLGSKAGRLLVITAALAYAFTLFSGFGTFFTSFGILPRLLGGTEMSFSRNHLFIRRTTAQEFLFTSTPNNHNATSTFC